MKRLPQIGLGLLALLVLIQLIRPERSNPPVTGDIGAPPAVAEVLKRACYDCHSNETKWPWYSQVAPVSWLVAHDVNEGREELNFSEWQGYEEGRKAHKLRETAEQVEWRNMPLEIYVPLHPEAKLTDAERILIVEWAKGGGK